MNNDQTEALRRTIADASETLAQITYEERRKAHAPLVGKCYKFRNSFSCPEKESDYWWLYRKVTGMDEFGWLETFSFQTSKGGEITIRTDGLLTGSMDGDVPISHAEFNEAWHDLRTRIGQLL